MKTPIQELASDIITTPEQAAAIVKAHKLPVRLPRHILDRVTAIRWKKITEATGRALGG